MSSFFQQPAGLLASALLLLLPSGSAGLQLAQPQGRITAMGRALAPWDTGPGARGGSPGEGLNLLQKAAAYRLQSVQVPRAGVPTPAPGAAAPVAPTASARTIRRTALQLEAAKLMTKMGQAKYVAGLSTLAVLAFVFRSKLRLLRQLRQGQEDLSRGKVVDEILMESVTEMLADVKEVPDPEKCPPQELAEVPPPMRRLRNIGASYVIPRARIARCCADSLSFDIPTLPCVWPLRAQLSRPTPRGPWSKIQLTVDIIAASGLPPLLTCARTGAPSRPEECGGTGGTGEAEAEAVALAAAGGPQSSPGGGPEEGEEGGRAPWLNICNASGTVVATLLRRQGDGALMVQRQDRTIWDIDAHLDGEAPRITISRQGQEMGQATSLGRGREEHLQLDTQPDVQSPESCVLLTCMLAVLVFEP